MGSSARPTSDASLPERALDAALGTIASHLEASLGRPESVREACAEIRAALAGATDPALAARCHARLLALLCERQGPAAEAVFAFLEEEARATSSPWPLAEGLLGARDPALRARAAMLALDLAESGKSPLPLGLATRLASLVEGEPSLQEPALLARIGAVLRRAPLPEPRADAADPVEALFLAGPSRALRSLAARLLDLADDAVPPDRARRLLGPEPAGFLSPYLAYTRATHRDLVEMTPIAGAPPPALDSLRRAEGDLGRPLLAELIGELGWGRLAWGLAVEQWVGLSVTGSFPLVLRPSEAELLENCTPSRRLWDRFLIVAHGAVAGGPDDGTGGLEGSAGGPSGESRVRRFRRYNLTHAEVLGDILEIAPLTAERVERILGRMDRIVDDFTALFTGLTEEAVRLPAAYAALKGRIGAALAAHGPRETLGAEATRLVQMFEEPRALDDVRTLHGLKRYLHQQGLRLAFRLFGSKRTANRTVDLVLASTRRILHVARRIQYLDFEPEAGADSGGLPFPVALVAGALGRQLLHGRQVMPQVEILVYGNEVQLYGQFRNHPVFVRVDFSPPLRGGMIDLEYYGVSQYELAEHPDLSLRGIRRIFRRMEFDVEPAGLRLHARYDKERALDLGDITEKAEALFRLFPYLMDVDWTIGGLDYPEPARELVAEAWADFFVRWGVLPEDAFLTADRRHILAGVVPEPGGEREVAWDGRGEYVDRFARPRARDIPDCLRQALAARGLADWAQGLETEAGELAQLSLERALLLPLREAVARGEVVEAPEGLRPAAVEDLTRDHEAERLARILREGGPRLADAARTASLVAAVERQLRFRTTGSVQGYPVERAQLALRGERIGLFVVRDARGTAVFALAVPGGVLVRRRSGRDGWQENPEMPPAELMRLLRRDNFLPPGHEPAGEAIEREAPERAAELGVPNPQIYPHPVAGDRIVPGFAASPGRAGGFARFRRAGATPEEFEGGVFFAPVLAAEDAPLLGKAAAIVSTGGGILSHLGLIALELRKPALILAGSWQRDAGGAPILLYRRPEYREEETEVGAYRVVLRRDLRECEEALREGDLVVVNADVGVLVVLGQDRDALALHQELRELERAAGALARAREDPEILALRGQRLRAVHQLEKLFTRLDRPVLARHAVWELLEAQVPAHPGAERTGRRRLLETLFAHPVCGPSAKDAAAVRLADLTRRERALRAEALRAVPELGSLLEIVFLRLGVLRVAETLAEARELLARCGVEVGEAGESPDLEGPVRARLEELREGLRASAAACAGNESQAWRWRHLAPQLARLEELLGDGGTREAPSPVPAADRERLARLAARHVLGPRDGGLELAPYVGLKAANLGEIARAVGEDRVPGWFAVTDRAFREVLSAETGEAARDLDLDPARAGRLGGAIEEVLSREGVKPAQKAGMIRQLWRAVRLPAPLVVEITAAYRSLVGADAAAAAAAGGGEDDGAGDAVAVRSSAYEEDTEGEAWAGQFDTFLFVRGEKSLIEHLRLAWAGLWTERAIRRRELGGGARLLAGGGVVVQRMVRSRISGVLHTVSLATGQVGEMVVNVGLGLGEGVVSGTVEVDQVAVAKESLRGESALRFRYRIGDKRERIAFDARSGSGTRRVETLYHQRFRPALEYVELWELARVAAQMEETYGHPLDLEFAFEGSALRILQARPIGVFHAAWRETLARFPLANPRSREPSRARPPQETGP